MSDTNTNISIHMSVIVDTEEEAIQAMETLSRVAAGLGISGFSVSLSINTFEADED